MTTTNDLKGTIVKATTKKALSIISDFEYSQRRGYTDIFHAYASCSSEKRDSFYKIQDRAKAQGADKVYICGFSSHSYSTVYAIEVMNSDTGEIGTAYIKDTKDNTFVVVVYESALAA